jgi:hypothetical protein
MIRFLRAFSGHAASKYQLTNFYGTFPISLSIFSVELLGVERTASREQLDEAYNKLRKYCDPAVTDNFDMKMFYRDITR